MNIIEAVKLYFKLQGEVSKMKSGFLTTEFWMSVLSIVGLVAGVFLGKIPVESLLIVLPIITSVYVIARTLLKKNPAGLALLEQIEKNILEKLPGYVPPAHE